MKTGRKISLIYSGITIGLIIIAGVVFYFFASNYVHSLYFHYLEEKAHAVAEEKFSKDELDPREISECRTAQKELDPYVAGTVYSYRRPSRGTTRLARIFL